MVLFAVQHQGWCAAAKNFLGYKKYGKSNACKNGKGGPWANDVYRITNPITATPKPYTHLGCWKDTGNRAVPQIDGSNARIRGNCRARADAINKCFQVAREKHMVLFAVQHQGWCAAAKNFLGYKKYGKSNVCKNGKGGPWANDVYRITNPLKPGKPAKPASKPASIKVLFGNWKVKFPKVKFNLVFKSGSMTLNGKIIRVLASRNRKYPASQGWFTFGWGGWTYYIRKTSRGFQTFRMKGKTIVKGTGVSTTTTTVTHHVTQVHHVQQVQQVQHVNCGFSCAGGAQQKVKSIGHSKEKTRPGCAQKCCVKKGCVGFDYNTKTKDCWLSGTPWSKVRPSQATSTRMTCKKASAGDEPESEDSFDDEPEDEDEGEDETQDENEDEE